MTDAKTQTPTMLMVGGPLWGKTLEAPPNLPSSKHVGIKYAETMHRELGPITHVAVYWAMRKIGHAFFLREELQQPASALVPGRP